MSQPMIYLLLGIALILPIAGAVVIRLLGARLSARAGTLVAAALFSAAIASVLVLARSDTASLQIGPLTLLLPVRAAPPVEITLPAAPPTPLPIPTEASPQ